MDVGGGLQRDWDTAIITDPSVIYIMTSLPDSLEPRWRRLPEERPRQILDAALEVFSERGVADARLDDIARRAGVSKGTIYLYFAGKEELFREVVRKTIVARIEIAELASHSESGSAVDALSAVMRSWFEFLRTPTYASVHRLVNAELYKFPDLAAFYADNVVMRGQRLIAGIIARGIESGEFAPVDPVISARILTGIFLVHGLWCNQRQFSPHLAGRTDDQVRDELMTFAFNALRARARDA
jgi:AcrR family transcriptional regulator